MRSRQQPPPVAFATVAGFGSLLLQPRLAFTVAVPELGR